MVNGLFNKQAIVLENFDMAFTQGNETPDFSKLAELSDLIVFGPSEGRISTFNVRLDTWIFPFFAVSGYYGQVFGEQTITLTAPINIESVTDIRGDYYGLNLLAVVPAGPVVISADYSWSWTTNERLDNPVLVTVSGIRVIKRFMRKNKPNSFFAVWGGAQFQNLENQTSGKINLGEALNLDGSTLDEMDQKWNEYTMSPEWDALPQFKKDLQQAAYDAIRESAEGLSETTVHYKFDKRLEYEWNMVLGGQFQINPKWQLRAEYGFLKSKQQALVSLNYRFGINKFGNGTGQ